MKTTPYQNIHFSAAGTQFKIFALFQAISITFRIFTKIEGPTQVSQMPFEFNLKTLSRLQWPFSNLKTNSLVSLKCLVFLEKARGIETLQECTSESPRYSPQVQRKPYSASTQLYFSDTMRSNLVVFLSCKKDKKRPFPTKHIQIQFKKNQLCKQTQDKEEQKNPDLCCFLSLEVLT